MAHSHSRGSQLQLTTAILHSHYAASTYIAYTQPAKYNLANKLIS